MFFHLNPILYFPVFFYSVLLLCICVCIWYTTSEDNHLLLKASPSYPTYAIAIILIWFIGTRPISYLFGDTITYANTYMNTSPEFSKIDWNTEWIFSIFRTFCRRQDWSVQTFFTIIAAGYVGFQTWACKKLLWEGSWIAMLFILSAFSFFTFGVNGLRNGLACSIMLAAIAYATNRQYAITAGLCILAFGIHRSTILPITALVTSVWIIKNPKWALYFWFTSIPLSLLYGDLMGSFFAGLGFDDRMQDYFDDKYYTYGEFSSQGFRWDFLLYSSVPVFLTWYVGVKNHEHKETQGKELADPESMRTWKILATTYILCNSFWVIINKVAFSNRFAYLSWFMYPMVIAYAFTRLQIWENQDRKIAIALLLHALFTLILHFVGIV